MSALYQPELGQMVFGQPSQELEAPRYLEAALTLLSAVLVRTQENIKQERVDDPFGNTGGDYRNDVFHAQAYSWGDDEQPYNFSWRDFRVSWYKYLGRGMSMNRGITPAECAEMLNDCVESLEAEEREFFKREGIF